MLSLSFERRREKLVFCINALLICIKVRGRIKMVGDVVDVNQSINGHTITVGWLMESLRQNDKNFQRLHGNRAVKEVTWKDVSDGKGFASEILRCTLTFSDSQNPSDAYTTILKIPGFERIKEVGKQQVKNDEKLKEMMESLNDIHEFECTFYNKFAPILDVPVPKVFKTADWIEGKQNGCIHMEDLTTRGKVLTFFEDINLTQVKEFIRHLAHMHKNILSVDPAIWQGKYMKNQLIFVNFLDMVKPMIEPFLKGSKREDVLRPILEKYEKFFENKEFVKYAHSQSYKDQKISPVIVHGDMHSQNIMFAIDEEGMIQNEIAAFVDWQIIHEGSPMSDVARFLGLCVNGTVRRQAEIFIFDYYLECLTKEFNGDSSKVPYTAEQLRKEYYYLFLSQVISFVGATNFLLAACKETNQSIKNAFHDNAVLKALHAFEDAQRLLEGEMKDAFEKYGM